MLGTEPAIPQAPDATDLPPIDGDRTRRGHVRLRNRPASAHEVSLRIEPGETVAFVGETGSGKSTIARLLTRFHDPDVGTVRIDGHDLREITIDSLRSQLGVVPQSPSCSPVSCATTSPSLARTPTTPNSRALDAVGISDLVERLGGPTPRPRAGRALRRRTSASRPRTSVRRLTAVLILDEATSNLDLNSETQVERPSMSYSKVARP